MASRFIFFLEAALGLRRAAAAAEDADALAAHHRATLTAKKARTREPNRATTAAAGWCVGCVGEGERGESGERAQRVS